jgi:hypothetical protein
MTPLDKVEALYRHLVSSYGEAEDAEVRAATKLLMVALYNLKEHAGVQWHGIVMEYLDILREDPSRFESFMQSNRSDYEEEVLEIPTWKPQRFQA